MIYQWRHSSMGAPAQEVGERLEKIKKRHRLDFGPKHVVKDAENPESPLHPCFEWDDAKAAQQYRESQAGAILASIVEVRTEADGRSEKVPVYIGVGSSETGSRYVTSAELMSDETLRSRAVSQTMSMLVGIRNRMKYLNELDKVWKSIDDTQQKLGFSEEDA